MTSYNIKYGLIHTLKYNHINFSIKMNDLKHKNKTIIIQIILNKNKKEYQRAAVNRKE